MFELIHNIFAFYTLPGLILGLGLCFLFISVPDNKQLIGYRKARLMMGWSYLVCFAFLVVESISLSLTASSVLQQIIMITIGIFQAFLFTFALTTLIDVKFFTWQRFIREAVIILMPAIAAFIIFFTCNENIGYIAFILLALFFLFKLVSYVVHFRHRYHDYERRMSNFFSDDERQRLQWVRRSFFAALTIGVLALMYSLFPYLVTSMIFSVVMGVYYTIFGIRFINYSITFSQIEFAMTEGVKEDDEFNDKSNETTNPDSDSANKDKAVSIEDQQLLSRLSAIMSEKRLFIKPDLTIEEIAVLTGVPYRSVSATINRCKGITFKSWVNSYRIEEAIRLIQNGYLKHQTIDALSQQVGFANRINFYRVFKSITGHLPTDY